MKNILFIIILISIFLSACHKPDETIVYDPDPLKLTIEYSSLGHILNWQPLTGAGFVEYRLWILPKGDSIDIKNPIGSFISFKTNTITTFQNSADQKDVENYRLEAVFDSRRVWSKNVKKPIDKRLSFKAGDINNIFKDESTNFIYIIRDHKMQIFDNDKEILKPTIIDLDKDWYEYGIAFANFEGRRELYLASKQQIEVFDAQTITKIKTIDMPKTIYHLASDNEHIVYSTIDSLFVLDRKSGKQINAIETDFKLINLSYLAKTNQFLATDSKNNIMYYSADNQTTMNLKKIKSKNLDYLISGASVFSKIKIFPDEQHFVLGPQLIYLDADFEFKTGVNPQKTTIKEIDIENYPNIYACTNDEFWTLNITKGLTINTTNDFNLKIIVLNGKKWLFSSLGKAPYTSHIEKI